MLPRFEEYHALWVVDSEFATDANGLPIVRCVAGLELRSGRTMTLWADQAQRLNHNPFAYPAPSLVLAWEIGSEIQSFLRLGWREPLYLYDLMLAFRMFINGRLLPQSIFPLKATKKKDGRTHWERKGVMFPSLLNALRHFRIPAMPEEEKEHNRKLAMREGAYSADEKRTLLTYCLADVQATARLVSRIIHCVPFRSVMLRSFYKAALERGREIGLPVDVQAWQLFQRHGAEA